MGEQRPADAHHVSRQKSRLAREPAPVDARPPGRAQVLEQDLALLHRHPGMAAGDGSVLETEVAGRRPPELEPARTEEEDSAQVPPGDAEQARDGDGGGQARRGEEPPHQGPSAQLLERTPEGEPHLAPAAEHHRLSGEEPARLAGSEAGAPDRCIAVRDEQDPFRLDRHRQEGRREPVHPERIRPSTSDGVRAGRPVQGQRLAAAKKLEGQTCLPGEAGSKPDARLALGRVPNPMSRILGCLFLALLVAACRDEQAGPPSRRAAAPAAPGAAGTTPGGATWASGTLRYLGSHAVSLGSGARIRVTHRFQVLQRPPAGYQLFVHLVDPRTLQMLANADHALGTPLEAWPVGQVVEDTQDIDWPEGSSDVRLLLGFWKGDQRLPVDQSAAQDGRDRMLGPVLQRLPAALPEYHVARADPPPRIDGVLDDPAWARAQAVNLVNSLDGSPARVRTTARLLWDDQFLYVSFDCEDPDVWATLTKRDDPLYTEEVVEVFIDADGDGRTYNEIEVSPANVVFDAYFPERRQGMDLSWDSGALTAVTVQGTLNDPSDRDEGWRVEMRIPIDRLASVPHVPPRPGDRWRFNLYRLEHHGRRQVEGQAYSPPRVGDFHALNRFAWLVFER